MMEEKKLEMIYFRPICTGRCSEARSNSQIYHTLSKQETQYEALAKAISRYRMAWLTPERMRIELADLSSRISSARLKCAAAPP